MWAAPGAGMAYILSHCHVGVPARGENKTQRTSLDIARCLWRKANGRLSMGRASEEKLAGRTTLVTQLTRGIGYSGGRTSQEVLDNWEVFYREWAHFLFPPACVLVGLWTWHLHWKQNLSCYRFQLPLRPSRPAFEAGSTKCHFRVTSKFGAWYRHTEAECLGPGLREDHVVSPSRYLC